MDEKTYLALIDKMSGEASFSAYMTLLDCLLYKVDVNGNPVNFNNIQHKIINQLQSEIQKGNSNAISMISALYFYGIDGFPPDFQKGLALAKRAAGLENSMGETILGFAYLFGYGVTQDDEKALHWFRMAEPSQNPHALNNLGTMYQSGAANMKIDMTTALNYYRESAERGFTLAMFNIGKCYENGEGVSRDYLTAYAWYKKAAVKGNPLAQTSLAILTADGLGTESNIEEAIRWFLRASWSGRQELRALSKSIEKFREAGYGDYIDKLKAEYHMT